MTDLPITRGEVEKLIERVERGQQDIKSEIISRIDRHETNHEVAAKELREREDRLAKEMRELHERGQREVTKKLDEIKDDQQEHFRLDEGRFTALEQAGKSTRIYGAIGLGVNAILAFLGIKAPTGAS